MHWRTVLIWSLAALFILYQFMLQSFPSLMVPELMNALKVNIGRIGLLSSYFFYPYLLLQIPSGVLVDRYGPRRVLLWAAIIVAVMCMIFAVTSMIGIANVSRIIMGGASAPGVVCAMCLASRWFPPSQFALFASLAEMIGLMGGAVGDYLLSFAVQNVGWRLSLGLCAVMGLMLAAAIYVYLKDNALDEEKPHCHAKHNWTQELLAVIQIRSVWLCCLYGGLMFTVVGAFAGLWAIPFLQVSYGFEPEKAASLCALVFIGVSVGTLLASLMVKHCGNIRPVMVGAAIVAFLAMTLIIFMHVKEVYLWSLFLLTGLSAGAYVIPFALVQSTTPPSIQGAAIGFTNMVCILVGACLQPIIGIILSFAEHHRFGISLGHYQLGLSLILLCLALAILLGTLVKDNNFTF